MPADVVWRIARRGHALDRLGTGARLHGGRWNFPGTAMIYTGRSIAIVALETFVHVASIVPPDLVLVRIELPEPYVSETVGTSALPADWDAVPPGRGTRMFGTTWAKENRSLVLNVPSALVREETNAILNPNHAEFADVRMTIVRPFQFDPRMSR